MTAREEFLDVAPAVEGGPGRDAGTEGPVGEAPAGDGRAGEGPAGEGATPTTDAESTPTPIELTEAALEALLFVAEKPLSRREIAQLAGTDRETVDARLGDLEVSLRTRGIRLVLDGDRVELATAIEGGALVARYLGADAIRISPASLETLAIVAYRQPVTKAAIERIRGVDSDYTIRTLLHRRFIVELGRSEAAGRPFLYGTGFDFLERFGLTSLDDLPPLDVDVAARLAEEGGEPVTQPLFESADLAASGRVPVDGRVPTGFSADGPAGPAADPGEGD